MAAYFFYYAAIAILGASVGYELGVGIMAGLGITSGVLQFVVGLAAALVFTAGVIVFNLPKVVVVVLSSVAGAGMIVTGVLVALGRIPLESLRYGFVGAFIHNSWFWTLVFAVVAAAGVALQLLVPAEYSLTPYGEEQLTEQGSASEPTVSALPPSGAGPEGVPAT